MCPRFVSNGNDINTGFHFDIDLVVWKHKVIKEKERFYIGILRPDGTYHSYHRVNTNGNVGTLLYVHDNLLQNFEMRRALAEIRDIVIELCTVRINIGKTT